MPCRECRLIYTFLAEYYYVNTFGNSVCRLSVMLPFPSHSVELLRSIFAPYRSLANSGSVVKKTARK